MADTGISVYELHGVSLINCPAVVFVDGQPVAFVRSTELACRIAALLHTHGLVHVPDTPEGITAS